MRVLVVDDHDLVRAGLAALLRTAPTVDAVYEAASGEQAVTTAAAHRPDVILMDIQMPDMDGIAATTRILSDACDPMPRILILTTFDLDEYVHAALLAGASGFLLKSTPAERLFAAIDAVAVGDLPFTPSITRRLIRHYIQRQPLVLRAGSDTALTPREQDVLSLVGHGLANGDIAERLHLAEGTVKSHLHRAMTKLNLTSRAQAVAFAYQNGLVRP